MIDLYTWITPNGLKISIALEELGLPYEIKHYQRDPKTMLAPPALKAVHPLGKSPVISDSGRVIAEEVDENLYLASRNLVNVLVVEPRYADPVSLVHYKKVLVTKGAVDKLKEMFA